MYIQELLYTIDLDLFVAAVVVGMSITTGCLVGWVITQKKDEVSHTTTGHVLTKQEVPTIHVHAENTQEIKIETENKKVGVPLRKSKKIIVR